MKLWQKIYINTLMLFLPVLNIGLFFGAWMVFDYNLNEEQQRISEEVNLLSHTIVNDIEILDSEQRLDEGIVEKVAAAYINYVSDKDEQDSLILEFVDEETDLVLGEQHMVVTSQGQVPVVQVRQLLQAPYEGYELSYVRNLTDFYNLWQSLKVVFTVISLLSSLLLALILYVLLYEITVPLQELTESVKRMKRGKGWKTIKVKGSEDVAQLTESFNEMGDEIQNQMLLLKKEVEIKQQLVDDLAHELRTPLTAIYGYAEYLQKAPCSEEERIDALEYIMDESKRLSHMGQVLLSMAIFREDYMMKEEVQSDIILKDVLMMLENILLEKRIKIKKDVPSFQFKGDRTMLICLLRNIIENAVRASDRGAKIWISMLDLENEVEIRIKDEGIGIEEKDLEKITDAFYRVDNARSRSNGGAGIGLNLSALIVERHMGSLEFESELGVGTTVLIHLPKGQEQGKDVEHE